jgi:transposase
LEPRLAEAQASQRTVFFMDAAHFVFAPFMGIVWCVERLFVKAPAGRQRVNVLAALNAITHEVFTVQNLTYITAETVCELLRLLAGTQPGIPMTVILDNARYQRCALVQAVAQDLDIELLYLPTYSPNLHLIERLWKFVKKQCLYSKYYPDSESFHHAIRACIEQAPTTHQAELKRLLTLRFQTFQEVPVIAAPHTVSKSSKKKVLSKAT